MDPQNSNTKTLSRQNSTGRKEKDSTSSNSDFTQKAQKPKLKTQETQYLKVETSYLSKSQEYLPKQLLTHKRNSSDIKIFEKSVENLSPITPISGNAKKLKVSSKINGTSRKVKNKLLENSITNNQTSQTSTTETDSDDVELRRPKGLTFKRVLHQSIRGSLRLVRRIRPKSDSEATAKESLPQEEKYRRFRDLAIVLLENSQQSLYLQMYSRRGPLE